MKLIFDAFSMKLLGAQMISEVPVSALIRPYLCS